MRWGLGIDRAYAPWIDYHGHKTPFAWNIQLGSNHFALLLTDIGVEPLRDWDAMWVVAYSVEKEAESENDFVHRDQ